MSYITDTFYAECSLPSMREHSFTVWTNIGGLARELLDIGPRWHVVVVDRDGEHLCLVITLYAEGYYAKVIQLIADCVTVENMLEFVAIPEVL